MQRGVHSQYVVLRRKGQTRIDYTHACILLLITGLTTHSAKGQTSYGCWHLSSSSVIVCETPHMQRNSQGAERDGGPVVLRLVWATPCFDMQLIRSYTYTSHGCYVLYLPLITSDVRLFSK